MQSFLVPFWRTLEALWRHLFWLLSGIVLGSFLVPFWGHFGVMFVSFFVLRRRCFLVKTKFYPHGSSICESSHVFFGFFAVGAHLRNRGFTCMGAHFPRICLRFLSCFFDHQNGKKMKISCFSLFPLFPL